MTAGRRGNAILEMAQHHPRATGWRPNSPAPLLGSHKTDLDSPCEREHRGLDGQNHCPSSENTRREEPQGRTKAKRGAFVAFELWILTGGPCHGPHRKTLHLAEKYHGCIYPRGVFQALSMYVQRTSCSYSFTSEFFLLFEDDNLGSLSFCLG